MYYSYIRTRRLIVASAVFVMLLAISMYVVPREFRQPYYNALRPHFPYLSTVLLGGGVLLLLLVRFKLARWTQRLAVLVPAVPLLVLAKTLSEAGLRVAPFVYGFLALGLVVAPWLETPPAGDGNAVRGRDLLEIVIGLIQGVVGFRMLAYPGTFSPAIYAAILPILPLVGIIGMVGAVLLIVPRAEESRRAAGLRRAFGVLFPIAVAYSAATNGLWVGILIWGILVMGLLTGGLPVALPGDREISDPSAKPLDDLERSLEIWMWGLVLAVLLSMVVVGPSNHIHGLAVDLFALAMSLYNLLAFWMLRRMGAPSRRIWWHLTFVTIALGLVADHVDALPDSLLIIMAVIPSIATRELGTRAGWQLLAVCIGAAAAGDTVEALLGDQLLVVSEAAVHLIGQTLLLLAAGVVGVRNAGELVERHLDLQAAHQHLQAQGEELVAQQEELQAQNDELVFQRETLRTSETRFRSAFGQAPIGMALADFTGRWTQVNTSFATMLGYTVEELQALDFRAITHPTDMAESEAHLNDLICGRRMVCQFEMRYLHRYGYPIWTLVSASAVHDSNDRPIQLILHIQDITARKTAEAQLIQLANYDSLTGLYNRHRFLEELERELAQATRYETQGALLFLDLDQFKYVNDTLGHQAGDDLLKSMAGLIQQRLRRTDISARLGGDEFAIVLPRASMADAKMVAEDLLTIIRQHLAVLAGQPVTMTVSMGIALFPEHGTTAEEILARADVAMYQAKERGRNGCCIYRPDHSDKVLMESKLTWEGRIRWALEHDRFVVHFQPIMDVNSGEIARYELLLRMLDDSGQLIPPGAFLHVAERFGLIHAIDRWVVRKAIRLIHERQQAGERLCLEVNLSGKAFADHELLPLVQTELAETGIDPSMLVLEITETAAISDTNLARTFVEELEALGCRFAIDDFGAGFSSFTYLKHLSVDYLKIDGSFIRNLAEDPVDQHMVRIIVDLARGLGKRTIAEFVGDERTLQLVREYGVDFAQGYYIGRPGPLDEVRRSR